MQPEDIHKQLRRKIQGYVQDLAEQSVHGQLSPQQLEELERLGRLFKLYQDAQRPNKWGVAGVFIVTLSVISFLLFFPMPSTVIELDLKVSGLQFTLAGAQALSDKIVSLAALDATGLQRIELPRQSGQAATTLTAEPSYDLGINLVTAGEGERAGSITLPSMLWPAGITMTLEALRANQYRLGINAGTEDQFPAFAVSLNGPVRMVVPDHLDQRVDYHAKSVQLVPRTATLVLDVTPVNRSGGDVLSYLEVKNLAFSQVQQIGSDRPVERRVSTLLSGQVYLESLNGRAQVLRPGEWLQFAASQGEIRHLEITENGFALRFHGQVHGMTLGTGANQRSIMPTMLEWLLARQGLMLLWGATSYAFTLVLLICRWMGKPLWKE